MARIVRGNWGPAPFSVTFGDKTTWLGCGWGIKGAAHPTVPSCFWVTWLDGDTGQPETWPSGESAEGYYYQRDLAEIGTAFVELGDDPR